MFLNFMKNDVQYLEKLHDLHNDLPFLTERIKIEKVEKLVANLHDKTVLWKFWVTIKLYCVMILTCYVFLCILGT